MLLRLHQLRCHLSTVSARENVKEREPGQSSAMSGRGFDSGAALDALDAGIVGISPDWRLIYWNAPAERLTGINRADVLGANVWGQFSKLRDTDLGRAMQDAM